MYLVIFHYIGKYNSFSKKSHFLLSKYSFLGREIVFFDGQKKGKEKLKDKWYQTNLENSQFFSTYPRAFPDLYS